jgi:hypothetical protein
MDRTLDWMYDQGKHRKYRYKWCLQRYIQARHSFCKGQAQLNCLGFYSHQNKGWTINRGCCTRWLGLEYQLDQQAGRGLTLTGNLYGLVIDTRLADGRYQS